METDLSLVSTEDLIAELLGRCDHGIIATMKYSTEERHEVTYRYVGKYHTVIGLAFDIQHKIFQEYNSTVNDADEESG